jgi:hypothetical protein
MLEKSQPEEQVENLLLRALERAAYKNKDSDLEDVEDWLNNPLTLSLLNTIHAYILGMTLGFMTNQLDRQQRRIASAKIAVFGQIREYLSSGTTWLEEKKLEEKLRDVNSNGAPRNSGADESNEEDG